MYKTCNFDNLFLRRHRYYFFDVQITELKAIHMQIEKDLRTRLTNLQKEHQETIEDLQVSKIVSHLGNTSVSHLDRKCWEIPGDIPKILMKKYSWKAINCPN